MITNIELFNKEEDYIRIFTYGCEKIKLSCINDNKSLVISYGLCANLLSNVLFEKDIDNVAFLENDSNKQEFLTKLNNILFSNNASLINNLEDDDLGLKMQKVLQEVEFSWLNKLKEQEIISEKRLKDILALKVSVEYIPDDTASIMSFITDSMASSRRLKHKVERVEKSSDYKISIIKSEDVIDIMENEKKSLEKGDDITNSSEIKRASILKDNAHMIKPYPLKSVKREAIEELEKMKLDFPNFVQVIEDIVGYVVLSSMGKNSYFQMKPILLAGDPGVGKTAFAQKVAKILDLAFQKLPFPTISASWVITGLDLSFKGGKQGKLFDFLAKAEMANPIVFLDELDKSKQSSEGGNPLDILHDLLEGETSTDVIDEAMNLGLNASKIIWMATANHLDRIPESILSRFKIYEIKDIKNESEKIHVIKNVYKNMISNQPNSEIFNTNLSEEVAIEIKDNNIRVINNILSIAIARAAARMYKENQDGLIEITLEDVK